MRRLPFLPVFFATLSIAFVIVLGIRLHYASREESPAAAPGDTSAALQTPEQGEASPGALAQAPQTSDHGKMLNERAWRPAPSASAPAEIEPGAQGQPEPPGVIARALAPLVKALAGGRTGARPAKPAGGVSSSRGSSQNQPSAAASAEKQAPKDPNSDTTPPRLLSIEFVPPEIHDGEESSAIITATDDLSGIRGVSGTISSPTGKALQGFAAQHEGDTNRYVGRVAIPKNAEEGLWRVHFLNLSDNASNSVTLSDAQGSIPPAAVLRVVSANSDSTPPVLKNIWLERRSMRGGEKNIVFVEATDDKSGVNLASAVFISPSKLARVGAGCQRGDGDVWRCELSVPACVDCGDWPLEQVTLQDKAGNLATFRQDNPIVQAVRVSIQGDTCDNLPPALQSLVLDSNDIAVGPNGAIVTVTVMASDALCSVAGISGQYTGPGAGSGGFFPLQRSAEGTWVGRISLDAHAARGLWRINSIQLTDQGHNLRIYYASDPLLQNGVFHVR